MVNIPKPSTLTLDPNDENIILEIPDDRDPNDEQNETSDGHKKKVFTMIYRDLQEIKDN